MSVVQYRTTKTENGKLITLMSQDALIGAVKINKEDPIQLGDKEQSAAASAKLVRKMIHDVAEQAAFTSLTKRAIEGKATPLALELKGRSVVNLSNTDHIRHLFLECLIESGQTLKMVSQKTGISTRNLRKGLYVYGGPLDLAIMNKIADFYPMIALEISVSNLNPF